VSVQKECRVYCKLIYNCQKLEATMMSFNRCGVHPDKWAINHVKTKHTIKPCYDMTWRKFCCTLLLEISQHEKQQRPLHCLYSLVIGSALRHSGQGESMEPVKINDCPKSGRSRGGDKDEGAKHLGYL
jgi:hypothetical protein